MALWNKTQQLPDNVKLQLHSIYGDHLPIEVRHYLAQWIEEQDWNGIDPDNPMQENYMRDLYHQFLRELDFKIANLQGNDAFYVKLRLNDAANSFKQRHAHNPASLMKVVRHCINSEMKLVQQVEQCSITGQPFVHGMVWFDPTAQISQELDALKRETQEKGESIKKMEQEQESFEIRYHECSKVNVTLQSLSHQQLSPEQRQEAEKRFRRMKEQAEYALRQMAASLIQDRLRMYEHYKEMVTRLTAIKNKILNEHLIKWKREQQLAGNGAVFNNNLDQIQEWCESLSGIMWLNRHQIQEIERLRSKCTLNDSSVVEGQLPSLVGEITHLLSSLVSSCFVIERQPPQVMKTNTRFTASVRLLVGGKLNLHMTPPQVKVSIVSESQSRAVLSNESAGRNESSGEILNNTGTMEYHQATKQLTVNFRNMQLRKIKRAEKKGTESVMDEKFSLLFQSSFSVGNGELMFQVWTLSLPVVVIVHGNQEPHAWATASWDNAFAEKSREPFQVPDKVPWPKVAEMLNMKFRAACGRELSDNNLHFLAGKIFRNFQIADPSGLLCSWGQFCKEALPEKNFTFWEWFYAILKLTREHLRGPWNDGLIIGFLGRREAEEMLLARPAGTFLLRFSDSELGGIAVAWVAPENSQNLEHLVVYNLQPSTHKDFSIRSLSDRLSDLKHLLTLYPDIPKEKAFGKYYTPVAETQPSAVNGYIRPMLVTLIPGMNQSVDNIENVCGNPLDYFSANSPDPFKREPPSVSSVCSDSAGLYLGDTGQEYSEMFSGLDFLEDMDMANLSPFMPNQSKTEC